MPEEGGFFEVMSNAMSAIASGVGDLVYPESGSTMDRLNTQARAELASALFGGSDAYVAYGDGQKAIEAESPQMEAPQMEAPVQAVEPQQVQAVEAPQMDRGGMEI
jgi:hypothetical protein